MLEFRYRILSTPFDISSADFLADLMPAFKISSSDLNNKPFVEYLSKFGKPLIFQQVHLIFGKFHRLKLD